VARDEYTARINRVIDYINAHLGRELTLEELARVACFSPYHFHRIFGTMTGERLSQYIGRLRLEKAASFLRHSPDRSVTEIALDSGFSSSATFARAFKRHFGVSASEWRSCDSGRDRNLGQTDRNQGQADRNPGEAFEVTSAYLGTNNNMSWRITMKGESKLKAEVEIQKMPPMHVAYVRHVGPYAGDTQLFEGLWQRLCTWAGPRGLIRPPETKMLCIYHDDPNITEEDKLRVSVGVTVPPDTKVEGEIGALDLPGGQYAVAKFELDPSQYGDAWSAVFGGWLPQSGYQPDDAPAFEMMLGDPKEHPEGKHAVAICVPVKPM
jgi:AraC family transcriptional regulator